MEDFVSQILGWLYFSVWSFSFYPQVYLNYRLKSCQAISKVLLCLNIVGFYSYSLYTLKPNDLVSLSDKVFAIHAFTLSVIIVAQCYYYDHMNKFYIPVLAFILVGLYFIDTRYLGPIKVIITLVKYLPQIRLNYTNHSTIGFSTTGVLMDSTGGILSLLQLFYDAYLDRVDFSHILNANATKLGLSSASLFMDFILISQAVTYRKPNEEIIKDFV